MTVPMWIGAHARWGGPLEPGPAKVEAPGVQAEGFQETDQSNESHDSERAAPAPQGQAQGCEPRSRQKREADLRARLALAGGHVLESLDDGTYEIVSAWGGLMRRECVSLEEAERFLQLIGGPKA